MEPTERMVMVVNGLLMFRVIPQLLEKRLCKVFSEMRV